MIPKRIVAEITRNWDGEEVDQKSLNRPPLSKQFEQVIDVNAQRGYSLESWRLTTTYTSERSSSVGRIYVPAGIVETIIAVFIEEKPELKPQEVGF